MRDFPSCFGENGVQVADASCSSVAAISKASHNLVTCMYQCKLFDKSCLVTIIWSKNMINHCLSIEIHDLSHQCLCKVEVKPSLFSKRKGSKCLEVMNSSRMIHLFWDLSMAKFGSGPEPLEGYYIALLCDAEMVLVIGDLKKEAFKKTNCATFSSSISMFISKREHVSGKKVYATKAQFFDTGENHELEIVCDTNGIDDPSLEIHIDSKSVLQVKHLRWKFRGNCSILVDDLPVEIFWDVHSWLFGGAGSGSAAVFMFQTCLSAEKLWTKQTLYGDCSTLPWHQSESFKDSKSPGLGFSLILYAWKNE